MLALMSAYQGGRVLRPTQAAQLANESTATAHRYCRELARLGLLKRVEPERRANGQLHGRTRYCVTQLGVEMANVRRVLLEKPALSLRLRRAYPIGRRRRSALQEALLPSWYAELPEWD